MSNKKVIIVSIVSVLLLVVAIIATSYAVFTANLTGTKENKLTTGYVTMNCTETNFNLTNTHALTDAEGIALGSGNTATCTLTSTMAGTMTVGYDIGLTDVDTATPSDGVGTGNVKIQAKKSIDSGADQYLAGTSANAGVLVSSIASSAGTYDSTNVPSYKIDSATVTGNHTIVYTVKSWVTSIGGSNSTSTTNGKCSDTTYTTESTCEAAGEIWGTDQTATQAGGSFSFKLKIGATQVLS
ncbi:MAG: hypothetical protein IJL74_02820 [Bacilli bacterium]|nr:hypothetical protein [Bacilli bacterium]